MEVGIWLLLNETFTELQSSLCILNVFMIKLVFASEVDIAKYQVSWNFQQTNLKISLPEKKFSKVDSVCPVSKYAEVGRPSGN